MIAKYFTFLLAMALTLPLLAQRVSDPGDAGNAAPGADRDSKRANPADSKASAQDRGSRPQLVEIVASGIGRNEAEATKDALSNAVRQAIGAVVSAETLVKNDEVVRDQILTYSDGFVEKYDTVGKPRVENGLASVTIRAQVRRDKLIEKVRAAKIAVAEVNGQDIFAQITTQREQRRTGAALLAQEFEGMPAKLVTAAIVGKPAYDERNEKLEVVVRIGIDSNAYNAFQKRLAQRLEQMGIKYIEMSPSHKYYGKALNGLLFPRSEFPDSFAASYEAGVAYRLLLCDSVSRALTSSRWRVYLLNKEMANDIDRMLHPPLLKTEVQDRDGKAIDMEITRIGERDNTGRLANTPVAHGGHGTEQLVVFPLFGRLTHTTFSGEGLWLSVDTTGALNGANPTMTENLSFKLSPDAMKSVSKVICSVSAEGDTSAPNPGDTAK